MSPLRFATRAAFTTARALALASLLGALAGCSAQVPSADGGRSCAPLGGGGGGGGAGRPAPVESCLEISGSGCSTVSVSRVCLDGSWVCPRGTLLQSRCACIGMACAQPQDAGADAASPPDSSTGADAASPPDAATSADAESPPDATARD